MDKRYDSSAVNLASFDRTYRPSLEQDYISFWQSATNFLDHQSLMLMFTALAAFPILGLAYFIDYKQKGPVLQNRGSYRTD